MVCVLNPVTDIYFNLAAEEYLLKDWNKDVFMLWKSEPAVVVGKHQTTLAEFNYKVVKEHGIKVARRLSGGGTVYHDEGNLNFTFIRNEKEGKLINFRKYTQPIQSALKNMGLSTRFEGHNNLTVEGLKISGNAEHIFKNRVLHHGTLLFSTDLGLLNEVFTFPHVNYQHKGVRSVPAKVTNIRKWLHGNQDIASFQDQILNFILGTGITQTYSFKSGEVQQIKSLASEKYASWQWIYGYSPTYRFQKTNPLKKGIFNSGLLVQKGRIAEIKLKCNVLSSSVLRQIEDNLLGKRHEEGDLVESIKNISVSFPEVTVLKDRISSIFF